MKKFLGVFALILLVFTVLVWPEEKNFSVETAIARLTASSARYPISFVIFSDNHCFSGDEIFAELRDDGLAKKPDFFIHLGDLTDNGAEPEYDGLKKLLRDIEVPFFPVVGNHDLYADDAPRRYQKMFGKWNYYFDYGPARFIFLRTAYQLENKFPGSDNHQVEYYLSDSQIEHLEKLLAGAKMKFIFMHVPPQIDHYPPTTPLNFLDNADRFMNLLKKYQVTAVFMGHRHIFDRYHYGSTEMIIVPSSGGPGFGKVLATEPDGGAFFGYLFAQITSATSIRIRVISCRRFARGYELGEDQITINDFANFTISTDAKN